jgi:cytochrome c oxidase subunit II
MNDQRHHFRNVVLLWLLATVIVLPIVIWVIGPGLPPGNGSVEAHGQVVDNTVLLATATPVALGVLVYFLYALWAFREREPETIVDGPAIRGNSSIQFWWLIITTTMVLFLAAYGSVRLLSDGSGGGQGPNPIATPVAAKTDPPLQVQVIAQQWEFTYRYPTYGGVETAQLEIPVDTQIAFHVTSLDAIHSFWAYELGVKADANPGVDNVAYVKVKKPRTFQIRCAELCGLWHGYMYDTGQVVSHDQFTSWIAQQRKLYAGSQKYLPPYAPSYAPDPTFRAG